MRSAAQMVSYEVSIGFVMITVLLCVGSLNLSDIVMAQRHVWFAVPLLPMFVVFFISALAETNRPPFDLPEAESELVAGYFSEYSSMAFALFFLGEYAQHDPDERHDLDPVPGRLAAAGGYGAVHLDPRVRSGSAAKICLRPVPLPLGARDIPALPLRPAHAAGLEGLPAAVAALGRADGRRADGLRMAAVMRPRIDTGDAGEGDAMSAIARAGKSLLLAELLSRHRPDLPLSLPAAGDDQLSL